MRFKQKTIPLHLIDADDDTYRITTETCVKLLCKSIQSIGLLHPPLLIRNKSDYRIVSGFRRISALRSINSKETEARILCSDMEPIEYCKIAVSENALQRSLNVIEKAGSINLLSSHVKDPEQLVAIAASTGVPCDKELCEKLISISRLPDSVKSGLLEGHISMPAALMLEIFTHETVDLIIGLFKELNLSLNKQREMISLINEIAHRDDTAPITILNRKDIIEIMENDELDCNQKAQKMRSCLNRIRFPEISKAEENFSKHVKRLQIGKGIKLIPPKNFEGVNYIFQLTFKNIHELENEHSTMDRVIQDSEFKEIFKGG